MDFIRTLVRDAMQHLAPHGVLVLEIGNERENFEAAFPRLEAVWLETSAGDDQVLLLTHESLHLAGVQVGQAMPATRERAGARSERAS
jgi:ribosomal protein L3 glutamine methyltransferase